MLLGYDVINDTVQMENLDLKVWFLLKYCQSNQFLVLRISKPAADQEKAVCEFLEDRDVLITFYFVFMLRHFF